MTDDRRLFVSLNPANGEQLGATPALDHAQVDAAIDRATLCAARWAQSGFAERRVLLNALADGLDRDRERLANLVTGEMGKLAREATAEIGKCALVCRYYAEHGERLLADEEIETDARRSLVVRQPLGPILAIMPWNFPFWQVFRFAAPAVMAGNVVLLKHASNVMLCGAAIADLFDRAGAPAGLFTHLPIGARQASEVIEDPRVRAVTLTGSGPAGSAIAARAGKVLKKSVLELGGSDPFIVLGDADLDLAVAKAVQSRFMNAGQSCIAAKRFIVVDTVADAFEQRFVEVVRGLRPGDPTDPATTLAPMARSDLRDELHAQVRDSVHAGARLLTGGEAVAGAGCFYQPTVLADVRKGMRAYCEELFGPVASIQRVADVDEAVKVANDSEFGLGGSVWTRDRASGLEVARRLECGCAFVNELVKSDPRLPFGGIKSSGFGRELAREGLHEFVNTKTIWID